MKLKMLFTFLIAWYKFVKRGCELLPRESRDARLAKCKACDKLKHSRCQVCGCWVSLKTWCIDEKCPINLW